MSRLRTCLVGLAALLIAGAVSVQAADLIFFDENGGGANPRGLYDFDSGTGSFSLRATVGGSERFFSLARRPSDGKVFAAEVRPSNGLWTIDLDTGATQFVVGHGLPTVADITFHPTTSVLYGLTRNTPYSLYTIDPATGGSTLIGATDNEVRTGLSFSPGGVLYGMQTNGNLYTVDPSTAKTTFVGGSGALISLVEDATFTAAGELFVVDWDGELFQIDPATGFRTQVGTTGMGSGLTAIIDDLGAPLPCPGDFDCDGDRDFDDIDAFVEALNTGRCKCPNFANCDPNGDGKITFADIDPFIALLGVPCP